ncbi:hypothetical protein SAMD00023353_7600150 [Rosellinia necatrix]|uniref:Uncharacterized protein n=1 Tax=Rosellinia necatrix TaxID=77044 RepID=A0A1S8AAQ1_ROSNE|nr:hypothetical protein SAMD00023353_7600150 [Rosellinia necatrix]
MVVELARSKRGCPSQPRDQQLVKHTGGMGSAEHTTGKEAGSLGLRFPCRTCSQCVVSEIYSRSLGLATDQRAQAGGERLPPFRIEAYPPRSQVHGSEPEPGKRVFRII